MTQAKRDVAIITDSTCDIPPKLLDRYQLTLIPLYLIWGDEQLRDGVDIDQDAFFDRLSRDPVHPKTAQATPGDFIRVIGRVTESLGAREILIITVSKALSGTYASAQQARKEVDVPVHVVDSRSVSMGVGWQVLAAARAREEGAGVDAMIAAAERVRERSSLLLTVDTLEYLHRGGRIGGAAKLLASVFQLKPLLAINHDTGTLEAVEKIRTRRKALQRLVDETFVRIDPDEPAHVGVVHGAAPGDARSLLEEVEKRCQRVESYLAEVTPVLGVHGGPGVVGIAAYND